MKYYLENKEKERALASYKMKDVLPSKDMQHISHMFPPLPLALP
jgi:hypothetical protein